MSDQPATPAEKRKVDLRIALEEVLRASGAAGGDPYDGSFSWPLMLVDAALKSEAAGDADAQDRLIEAIGVLLGMSPEEKLSIPKAAGRLGGDGGRSFILSALERQQTEAEKKVAQLRIDREQDPDPDGRTDLAAQSRHQQGLIEAFGFASELVNLSVLPGDNDQQVGELISVRDAEVLTEAFEAIPESAMTILSMTGHDLPPLLKRLKKLAATSDARQENE